MTSCSLPLETGKTQSSQRHRGTRRLLDDLQCSEEARASCFNEPQLIAAIPLRSSASRRPLRFPSAGGRAVVAGIAPRRGNSLRPWSPR